LTFLQEAHAKACRAYSSAKNPTNEKLKELSWECVELSQLLTTAQEFLVNLAVVNDFLVENNLEAARFHLKRMAEEMKSYLTRLFKKKRAAATHVLVIMVASEKRDWKPYAIPVQYIPYHSLKDDFVRSVVCELKEKMESLGLEVVGENLLFPFSEHPQLNEYSYQEHALMENSILLGRRAEKDHNIYIKLFTTQEKLHRK
jgi:hypothetical protein